VQTTSLFVEISMLSQWPRPYFIYFPRSSNGSVSPGTYSAVLLYLPFSSWALVGPARDGVPARAIATALITGTLVMAGIVFGARSVSNVN
jgi:hypothetical protein